MRESTFFKMLLASFAFVALACAPKPAFAQHGGGHGGGGGGGYHGGGGGRLHGGGGGGGGVCFGGVGGGCEVFSGGGNFRGGGPSGGSSMGRGAAPRPGGRQGGFAGRPSGAAPFNSRSPQRGGGSIARPPAGSLSGAGSRAHISGPAAAAANRATADGQWHSFAGARGAMGASGSARASGN